MSRGLGLALLLAAGAARAAEGAAQAAAPLVVHVYHTNDVHGWIMTRPDKRRPERMTGGAAALKALVDKDAGPKLLFDSGDWWQGTPEGGLTKGAAVAAVFNAVGYDAVELGNHEFDGGEHDLRALLALLKMPVLAANVYGTDGKRVAWTRPHIVKDVGGVKVGVFGLLTIHMDKLAFPKNIAGLVFRREVDEARDQVAALKKEGADVIIALTHVGYEQPDKPKFEGDQTIAREVAGIDLILGGHSHTTLDRPYRDPAHGTVIAQTGFYLQRAGRATLTFDAKSRRLLTVEDELVDLDPARVGSDAGVQAIVAEQTAVVGKVFETVIATATADLIGRGQADRESGLGSWMADCYKDWAHADVAIQNGGGIRADIAAGPVTLRHLYNVMPFENNLVKLRLSGAELRSCLDHGVGMGRIVQVGGVSAEYRRPAPSGRRLISAAVGGAPLDDARTYSVVTLDFLVSGGDGYQAFGAAPTPEQTGVLARDVLRLCAEKQRNIAPPAPGRLTAREN